MIISYKMAEVAKKGNVIDMPDHSDMIAEAMKEVLFARNRPSSQSTTSRPST